MHRFAIVYRPGDRWEPDASWQEQGLYRHGEYMDGLFQSGTLLYGGPFDDDTGGLAVVETPDAEAVDDVVNNDPAVESGLFEASVHPWVTVFDRPAGRNKFGDS